MIERHPDGRRRIDRVLSPDFVRGIEHRPLGTVRALRDDAAQEETDLSYLRRLLHARIDIVRAEQHRRTEGGGASVVAELAHILAANALGPAAGSGRHQTVEPSRAEVHRWRVEALVSDVDLSDVSSLPPERLASALEAYLAEESAISRYRREVQQVVDMLNAEIGRRYARGSASVDRLLDAERGADDHTEQPSPGEPY